MRVLSAVIAAAAVQWTACASLQAPSQPAPEAAPEPGPPAVEVDPSREPEFDAALREARWRWLRALDELRSERHDRAREELDQAYYTLALVDGSPILDELGERDGQAEVDALADDLGRAYLKVLPFVEHLSPDSPLSLVLSELADEILEELPEDAVPVVRIHQMAPRCDFPIDANDRVAASIHFFQTRARETWQTWTRRAGRYRDLILPILREEGLPEDLFYLSMIESGFNPRAYSRAHASGLWQFIRQTGRLEGLVIDSWVDERRDPVKSTRAAVQHLKGLYAEFGDWRLAAAAYNSGRGRVSRAIQRAGTTDFWQLPLPRETRNYVPLIMAAAVISKDPQRFGFEPVEPDPPILWEHVRLRELIDLHTAARLLGVSVSLLRNLNPELRSLFTPPGPEGGYLLKVPEGRGDDFLAALARLPKSEKRGVARYTVRQGDNLWSIARAFGVDHRRLAEANGLSGRSLIHPGRTLVVPILRGTAIPGPVPLPEGGGVHTVRSGESLWSIGRRYGVRVEDLRAWNGLANNLLQPGQRLKVGRGVLVTRQPSPAGADAPAPAIRAGRRVHTVRQGESLWSISRTHQVTVADLRSWNGLADDVIRPGQSLYLADAASAGGGSYTVVGGDTLYGIARRFGVDVADIARQNNLSLSSSLLIGMELHIPVGEAAEGP
ncbi:MAG: LysM peptidoglycan-binding domain-containing protein [Gemmatimonadaceae bacterium]|nr:LysM peptidoglycan-binding domain-containing protein [Gemmatimonadaceae bacterium]